MASYLALHQCLDQGAGAQVGETASGPRQAGPRPALTSPSEPRWTHPLGEDSAGAASVLHKVRSHTSSVD